MQWNVQGNELFFTCVHEIGHASIFEALGVNVIMIIVGPHSEGKCYYDHCSNRYNPIANRAGSFFERIFLQDMKGQEGDYCERISPREYEEDFCEWLFLKDKRVREVDLSNFISDYDGLPEPKTIEDEKQLNSLLQICRHINFTAVRAAIHKLYNTPMRRGNKVMSGRRFRKIINDNGGLYSSCNNTW